MIVRTDYRRGGAQDLTNYIKKDGEERVEVRTPSGRAATPEEWQEFHEYSEKCEFERHIIINPDPDADWSGEDLDRKTREMMSDLREERSTMRYLYSVHDTEKAADHKHVHVAAAGKERDMEMWPDDLRDLEEEAREAFEEEEKLAQAERLEEPMPEGEATADREVTR